MNEWHTSSNPLFMVSLLAENLERRRWPSVLLERRRWPSLLLAGSEALRCRQLLIGLARDPLFAPALPRAAQGLLHCAEAWGEHAITNAQRERASRKAYRLWGRNTHCNALGVVWYALQPNVVPGVIACCNPNLADYLSGPTLCHYLRDLFPLPTSQPVVTLNPQHLGGTVPSLASAAYGSLRQPFTAAVLPILADALEDQGCTERWILEHFRSGLPHARGCWALEAIRTALAEAA